MKKLLALATMTIVAACGGRGPCLEEGAHEFTAHLTTTYGDPSCVFLETFPVVGELRGDVWEVTENGLHYTAKIENTCTGSASFVEPTKDAEGNWIGHDTLFGADPPELYLAHVGRCMAIYELR